MSSSLASGTLWTGLLRTVSYSGQIHGTQQLLVTFSDSLTGICFSNNGCTLSTVPKIAPLGVFCAFCNFCQGILHCFHYAYGLIWNSQTEWEMYQNFNFLWGPIRLKSYIKYFGFNVILNCFAITENNCLRNLT